MEKDQKAESILMKSFILNCQFLALAPLVNLERLDCK
jgi:hypothetical protein